METGTGAISPADLKAITETATEYFQSWFAGDGERMRSVLHPALSKRSVRDPSTGLLDLAEDPAELLITATASGEGTRFTPRAGSDRTRRLSRHGHRQGGVAAIHRVPAPRQIRRELAHRERALRVCRSDPTATGGLTATTPPSVRSYPSQARRQGTTAAPNHASDPERRSTPPGRSTACIATSSGSPRSCSITPYIPEQQPAVPRPRARPISLSDWPAFQRDHSSRVCSPVNAGLAHGAMGPPSDRHGTYHGVATIGGTRPCFRRVSWRWQATARPPRRPPPGCRGDPRPARRPAASASLTKLTMRRATAWLQEPERPRFESEAAPQISSRGSARRPYTGTSPETPRRSPGARPGRRDEGAHCCRRRAGAGRSAARQPPIPRRPQAGVRRGPTS